MSTRPGPVQYSFFELEENPVLVRIRQEVTKLKTAAKAPNTFKAYAHGWKIFSDWVQTDECPRELFGEGSKEPLPTSPEIVQAFIAWASELREPRPYKLGTIQVALTAIKRYHMQAGHPVPMNEAVRDALAGVVRNAARDGERAEEAGKKHLTVTQLKKICHSLRGLDGLVVRDRAIILTGFVSALRRSDLSRLQTHHVHFEEGRVRLYVPYSKSDQLGKGRDVYMDPGADPKLCPVRALEAWKKFRLEYSGHFRGPLFVRFDWRGAMTQLPLREQGICDVLKRRLERAGEDARDYGAHSMRSGMITSAHAAGANLRAIMDRTGHKSIDTIMRYVKSAPKTNPLAGVL